MAGLPPVVLNAILKFQVKRRLARARDWREMRKVLGVGLFPAPRGVAVTAATVGGVAGEWLEAKGPAAPASGRTVLLYVHGGAFIACSPRTHRAATGALAQRGFRVFAPDYRLAPEHKFPAALDDVEAAYRGILASGVAPERVVLAGESAGGNLVLALILRLKATGGPLPAAVAAWSPAVDLTGASDSVARNGRKDAMLDPGMVLQVPGFYLPAGTEAAHPEVSPLLGDFTGAPPMLLHVGADEILLDDTTRMAAKLASDGVMVESRIWARVPHAWQLFPVLADARASVDATAAFLDRAVAGRMRAAG